MSFNLFHKINFKRNLPKLPNDRKEMLKYSIKFLEDNKKEIDKVSSDMKSKGLDNTLELDASNSIQFAIDILKRELKGDKR